MKDIFDECRILYWQLFFLRTLKIALHYLLVLIVSVEKTTVIQIVFPMKVICLLPLLLLRVSLYLVSSSFNLCGSHLCFLILLVIIYCILEIVLVTLLVKII